MPGKSVKNWTVYHGLRRRGYSKSSAARIANWQAGRKARRGRRKR